MKNNFIYLAILSMVSIMYPFSRGSSYNECMINCKDEACDGIGKPECNQYCSPICAAKFSPQQYLKLLKKGNDRYRSNY
jgi:hypothetical protein